MKRWLLGLTMIPVSVASAHPGHGADGGSHEVGHYLSEPLHVGILVAVSLLVIATLCVRRSLSATVGSE